MEAAAPRGLIIEHLSAGFQSQTVLHDLTLVLPRRGVVGLMGPAGVGKSTLLRSLSRWNDPLPSYWRQGRMSLDGCDLFRDISSEECRRRICLLSQKARLYTASVLDNAIAEIRGDTLLTREEKYELARRALEPVGLWESLKSGLESPVLDLPIGRQRALSIARLAAMKPAYMLIDEPLRDISEEEAEVICSILGRLAEVCGVLLITHNLRTARRLCDRVLLLVDGYLIEDLSAEEFFDRPKTGLGRIFIQQGNCPSLKGWLSESGEPDLWTGTGTGEADAPVSSAEVDEPRPGGFHWVIEHALGGMQRPGLLQSLEVDLDALTALRCRVLVTLTEGPLEEVEPGITERLGKLGIRLVHFPIPDMEAPEPEDALRLCREVLGWIDQGLATVMHCKAGLGRTGTMLACALVARGESPVQAVDAVRSINPYYIQSDEQLSFIGDFGGYLDRTEAAGT